jgi:hypothetical protein
MTDSDHLERVVALVGAKGAIGLLMQFNDGSYEAYTVTGLRLIGIHATIAAAAEQIAKEIGR